MLAIDEHMRAILEIPGARSVSLLDSDHVVAEFGHHTAIARAENGAPADVVRAIVDTPAFAAQDGPGPVEDVVLTTRHEYLLVTVVRGSDHSHLHLRLRLDRRTGNLALGQRALRRLAARLAVEPPARAGRGPVPSQRRGRRPPDSVAAPGRAAPVLPRRCPDPDRLARGPDGPGARPDRDTLERVLGALRSLHASPTPRPGPGAVTTAAT